MGICLKTCQDDLVVFDGPLRGVASVGLRIAPSKPFFCRAYIFLPFPADVSNSTVQSE